MVLGSEASVLRVRVTKGTRSGGQAAARRAAARSTQGYRGQTGVGSQHDLTQDTRHGAVDLPDLFIALRKALQLGLAELYGSVRV